MTYASLAKPRATVAAVGGDAAAPYLSAAEVAPKFPNVCFCGGDSHEQRRVGHPRRGCGWRLLADHGALAVEGRFISPVTFNLQGVSTNKVSFRLRSCAAF